MTPVFGQAGGRTVADVREPFRDAVPNATNFVAEIVGAGGTYLTCTSKPQLAVFCALSFALQVIGVDPTGTFDPDGTEQVVVTAPSPPVTVGAV